MAVKIGSMNLLFPITIRRGNSEALASKQLREMPHLGERVFWGRYSLRRAKSFTKSRSLVNNDGGRERIYLKLWSLSSSRQEEASKSGAC
mmetsp:Transcript_1565/g.2546  ORF Transcript_1565/g.2546 Transcript_1565/m.2546 type:complete len:90 (+) Transcript_1565:2856-3125(+)